MLLAAGISIRAEAGEVKLDGRLFTIPAGFTINWRRIAGPPLVERPITATFDDQGRLYVADSSGSNDNVQKQLAGESRTGSSAWKTATATGNSTRKPYSPTT